MELDLISEIKLDQHQAKIFLLVTSEGKMTAKTISEKLGISEKKAMETAKKTYGIWCFYRYFKNRV